MSLLSVFYVSSFVRLLNVTFKRSLVYNEDQIRPIVIYLTVV